MKTPARQFLGLLMICLGSSYSFNTNAKVIDFKKIENISLGHAYYTYQSNNPYQAIAILMAAETNGRLGKDIQIGRLFLAQNFAQLGLYEAAIATYEKTGRQAGSRKGRDQAWLEEAKLSLQLGKYDQALALINNIQGNLSYSQETDMKATKARALLELGQIKEAINAMPKTSDASAWALYQSFNIGVRLIEEHRNKKGAVILHRISRLKNIQDNEIQAIKDQANLALGFSLLKINKPQKARTYLENVHLKSHLSNIALLGMGWSYTIEENYEQALVFWLELKDRPYTTAYSYETMLAIPYALGKAGAFNQAIQHYQIAQQKIETDIRDMAEAKKKINSDLFSALINAMPKEETLWLNEWQNSPEAPEQRFLPLLLDNAEFQSTLREYRALLKLGVHVASLETEITQFESQHKAMSTDNAIAQLHLQYQTISQQTQKGLQKQFSLLRQQALSTLSRYQDQLNNYSEQINFGIAQAIEGGTFKTEERL